MRAEWDAVRCWMDVWVGINIRLAAGGTNIRCFWLSEYDRESHMNVWVTLIISCF